MRRGKRGRPHLLCPPCPPIGQSRGPEAESGPGPESSGQGAGRDGARESKAVRPRRSRCARLRVCLSGLPRARRCHGRSAPALRALSRAEERGHRSARSARSQDRCREAVSGRGGSRAAKPVSSVRLRGLSSVQCHRICIPRICFSQSYREPSQGRRYCVANLLGGVRPVRPDRVLQRSTPVLVPFLLRGQVRLPVILHDSGTLERGSNTVPSRHTTAISKTPRGPRQRREPSQRKSIGHSSWDNPGRQVRSESAPEAQVRSPASLCTEPLASDKEQTAEAQASDSSSDSQTEIEQQRRPSSPMKPAASPSRAVNGQSPSPVSPGSASASPGQLATGSVSGSQIPSKARGHRSRGSVSSRPAQRTRLPSASLGASQPAMRSGGSSQPAGRSSGPTRTAGRNQGNNQQTPQASASAQPAGRSTAAASAPTSTQRISISNQGSPRAQSPSTPPDPNQAASKAPSEPGDEGSKNNKQEQKAQATEVPGSSSVPEPERLVPCHSESSLEYMSESTTEITCKWPGYQLRCPRHCWLLQHLAY
ncbi:receptor expression-enhancing protein 6 isoform X2 [Arvicola amphibius]|uniref:receptor expression-enhancing protein 6 isoform X2 n=1 Tax=Arvicola amphibius TaxID=1047088 RepID=UPI0018E3D226|nr:receptor expression-enhancing protein 6 isoform X2 [Arvicola amphibius]